MVHLEVGSGPERIQVPCLFSINEVRPPFFTDFPESRGWSISRSRTVGITRVDGTTVTSLQIAAFLQEWLFFGLLSETLNNAGIDVNLSEFVQPNNEGRAIVTTRTLRRYLEQWEEKECGTVTERLIQGQTTLAANLRVVQLLLENHIDSPFAKIRLDLVSHLSILVLAETLRNAAMYIWKLPETSGYPLRHVGFMRQENILKDYLLKAGRCISKVEMLRTAVDNTGLYIAATIEWPGIGIQRNHDHCRKELCVAEQVDDATYQTTHTPRRWTVLIRKFVYSVL